ncbi:MAG: hypothetical protein CYPHOPRED_002858 [Cyphobasidiales sp. Tagirdzhanova-0007]|nr:MAG: hypothetical protein CYPHOPRED_002858 [Cyphobasidiales sp. Tagirdzhanova-0007]
MPFLVGSTASATATAALAILYPWQRARADEGSAAPPTDSPANSPQHPTFRLSIYDTPSSPILLVAEPPSALHLQVSSLRKNSEILYSQAASKLREVSNSWIGTERKIEHEMKSILPPDEQLSPGILYVGISTLLGSILTRSRSFPVRFVAPPIFLLASATYFLPKTSHNASLYGRQLEKIYAPSVYDAHSAVRSQIDSAWHRAQTTLSDSRAKAITLSDKGVRALENSSGLRVQSKDQNEPKRLPAHSPTRSASSIASSIPSSAKKDTKETQNPPVAQPTQPPYPSLNQQDTSAYQHLSPSIGNLGQAVPINEEELSKPNPFSPNGDIASATNELPPAQPIRALRASKVPTSRLARLLQYGNLAAGLGVGAINASLSRSKDVRPAGDTSNTLSQANINRIVKSLSKMRGAALKLGQFLSIQESKALPPALEAVLARVQNAADYMPEWQTSEVLRRELGSDWRTKFKDFEMVPFASASIGQVHRATLTDSRKIAVKIQFPGIANSIDSDISNLKVLLSFSALLPRGLYLDNTLRVMRRELVDECDYLKEAASASRFKQLLRDDPHLAVPAVIDGYTTPRILALEMMQGRSLGHGHTFSQPLRDHIGSVIMRLCLRELLEFRFMQTDPNWSNFLWNEETRKIELIDFGACQTYTSEFVNLYKRLLLAAVDGDRETCVELSRQLGYLTKNDSNVMVEAHVNSMLALAEPFQCDTFSFASQTITDRIRAQIPVILKHRLSPPPEATYSLNRKLSGIFLLCARLGSRVKCRDLLQQIMLGQQ